MHGVLALVSDPPGPHLQLKALPWFLLLPCALSLSPAALVPAVGPQYLLGLPSAFCFVLSTAAQPFPF